MKPEVKQVRCEITEGFCLVGAADEGDEACESDEENMGNLSDPEAAPAPTVGIQKTLLGMAFGIRAALEDEGGFDLANDYKLFARHFVVCHWPAAFAAWGVKSETSLYCFHCARKGLRETCAHTNRVRVLWGDFQASGLPHKRQRGRPLKTQQEKLAEFTGFVFKTKRK